MQTAALLIAGALLTSPEGKQNIPNYFENNNASGQRAVTMCNLNREDTNGPFKTCRYDCGRTLAIGARSVCPFVLQE